MKKRVLIIILAGLLLLGAMGLAWENISVYWNDQPAQIKTIQSQGETYVSVPDLAKYFPGAITQNFKTNRIDFRFSSGGVIHPQPVASPSASPTPSPSPTQAANAIIWGRAFYLQKDLEVPISNMEVQVRKTRTDIPASMVPSLFYSIVVNGYGEYQDLYPIVKKTLTDESGIFIINDIPPGNYELTARFVDKKHILGWRWPLALNKGDNLQFELSEKTAMVQDKNERQ